MIELALDLQSKPVYIMGHLHALWHTVLEQQEDGDLSRWSDQLIAQAAQWDGDATEFVTRLRERGWIDGHLVHDWIDYVGPYLTKKYSSGNVERLKEIWLKHGYKYGKGNGKFAKQTASRKRADSEQKASRTRAESDPKSAIPFPSLPNPSSPFPSEPDLTKPLEDIAPRLKPVAKGAEVWAAYAESYKIRYGVDPVRNQTVNSLLCKLVDKLGAVEAPQVAAFYVRHNGQWYVSKMHPPNVLVQDAEKLRTEWATGRTMTHAKAQQADRTATTGDIFRKLINEEAEKRERKYAEIAGGGVRTDEHDAV